MYLFISASLSVFKAFFFVSVKAACSLEEIWKAEKRHFLAPLSKRKDSRNPTSPRWPLGAVQNSPVLSFWTFFFLKLIFPQSKAYYIEDSGPGLPCDSVNKH